MSRTAVPAGADLQIYLTGAGLIDATPQGSFAFIDTDQRVLSALSDVEAQTDRKLVAVSATRLFDPPVYPRRMLPLHADIVSVTTLTVSGVAKIQNTDFFLLPENADAEGKPFNMIELATVPVAGRKAIAITGPWGYGLTANDGAWNTVLARAAYLCYAEVAGALTRGLVVWKDDVTTEQYGPDPLGFLRTTWDRTFEGGCQRLKRIASYFG